MSDKLTRFLFENRAMRGEIVQLEESYQGVLASYDYPLPIARLLGELMSAASLLTATLKFEGEVSLQLQSEGVVKYAVINGTHDQQLRGIARWDESLKTLPDSFSELFKKGTLAITLAPVDGERYQGIVALDKGSLAACLENYFLQSEQLLTKICLATSAESAPCAAGLLLQIVPQSSETYQQTDNGDFEHLSHLAATTKDDELLSLKPEELLYRLFHEEDVRVFEPQPVVFQCDCSKNRSALALRNVSKDDLLQIVQEEGRVKMNCQFCHCEYNFDAIDVENIHSDGFTGFDVSSGSSQAAKRSH
ncbi:Hsp33 family molecular chaperone HslO [Glaciecola sp. XM2]|uniref:Hsp33 family molecular chaperone HslO n=1 Tax=Glaciecola sp. XM2 TaxID=1914931 RepID=UPI001BDDD3EF|nr:Hsp33 family molecular chaperone HslO [Glaciecola sp. XM2]MBT1451388.1 Hsp33 family molecular chaperone HslO [Glaciecola sp. XM2]